MDPVALLPAVDQMQDVAGLGIEPADLMGLTATRDNAETRRDILVETHHALAVLLQNVNVMKERKIVQNGVVFREAEIVRRARPGNIDWNVVDEFPGRTADAIAHIGW